MLSDKELYPVKVAAQEILSKTSKLIKFTRFCDFRAGQVMYITTDLSIPPRMYSIASAEESELIEILYKIVPEGELTPKLNDLKNGSVLYVSKAFGQFTCKNEPAYFIAGGTGLAPFLSMIRSGNYTDKILIHGSRNLNDFYFSSELKKKLSENYIPCYTGKEKATCFQGRVTDYLLQNIELMPDYKYYICGSAEMVVDTRETLIREGIPFSNIHAEIYF